MLFRKIVFSALITGLIAGLLLGTLQLFTTNQTIQLAEKYEADEVIKTHHDHGQAHHHANDWQPADGTERIFYTFLSDILMAIAHALLLLSVMAWIYFKTNKIKLSLNSGLIIGFAAYLSFYVATTIGLKPELPGVLVADLHARQIWWLLAVAGTMIGLATLYFAKTYYKLVGLIFIIIPQLLIIPHPEIQGFVNTDPSAIQALQQLEKTFLWQTAGTNLLYWLTLGGIAGWLAKHKFSSF